MRHNSDAPTKRRATSTPLLSLAIFLLALAPRALWQGRFITIDESYHWFDRARLFLRAIRAGDWAATNLIGHPGVTTMWLGASGLAGQEWLAEWGLLSGSDPDLTRMMLRLPVAIVTALCIALGYVLLRQLLTDPVALVAALFWASDPFLVAHSQLLHVDALLTSFITLALLAALLAFRLERQSGIPIREETRRNAKKEIDVLEGDAGVGPLRWRWLLASAVFGGLALLTKSPAIIVPPMVALIALVGVWHRIEDRRSKIEDRGSKFVDPRSSILYPLLVWAVVAAAVWVALWPAAWVDLPGAVGSIIHQAEADGGSPHGWGNFFLGQAVDDPGPLFYPVAVALRLTPWVMLGLALICVRFIVRGVRAFSPHPPTSPPPALRLSPTRGGRGAGSSGTPLLGVGELSPHPPTSPPPALRLSPTRGGRGAEPSGTPLPGVGEGQGVRGNPGEGAGQGVRALVVLMLFVLLFALMISVPAKKFDRYALPIFPALNILAAAGLAWRRQETRDQRPETGDRRREKTDNGQLTTDNGPRTHRSVLGSRFSVLGSWFRGSSGSFVLCSLFFILGGANLAWYHPYELAYYNPLLGGGPAAARLIPVGWGEGLEQAGAYITAQPDGNAQTVATWYRPALKPYISATLVPLGDLLVPNMVGYAVLYIDQVQRRDDAAATDWLRANLTPIHTVSIHGIDYAEIYRVPRQPTYPIDADFGPAVHFRGYDLDTSTAAQGFVRLTVHWQARERVAGDLMLFVHMLDGRGERVGGLDVPPGGAGEPTSQWLPGGYVSAVLQVPVQSLPEDGWIAIGLYDPRDGARLELRAPPQPGAPDDGPNALLLGPLDLR